MSKPVCLNSTGFCVVLLLTKNTSHHAQDYGHCDKRPVPLVFPSHCGHPEKDEDERLTHAAPHL